MQRVGFVLFPQFQVMSFAAVSVFELANATADDALYDVVLLSETGGPIRSSLGFEVGSVKFDEASVDTLIVGGGMEIETGSPGMLAFIRDALRTSRRVASICTGAFILAEAGVFEGRRATTHWGHAHELKLRYPAITVEDDRIFVSDGPVWSSAGMTAGIDLALALVEADHGTDLARTIAKKLVVHHRRSGGQSQFSAMLDLDAKSDRVQASLDYAKRNLRSALSVDELAKAARLSTRQFSRSFRLETGESPARAVEKLRVEAARLMMEQTRHPIEMIANETGFADAERMRRAFLRAFGLPPQAIRRNVATVHQFDEDRSQTSALAEANAIRRQA